MAKLWQQTGYSQLRRGRYSESGRIYLVTAVAEKRRPVFMDWQSASIACRTFTDAKLLGDARLLCWVLMPDHVHWLLQLEEQTELAVLVGKLKAVISRNIGTAVWQSGFHDRAIRHEEDVLPAARYIVANPLRAGLVRRVGDYPYWDALWI